MLIMRLVGEEGTIGLVQSVGGVLSAVLLYLIGRLTGPGQRVRIMAFGLLLFTAGALPNAFLFNSTGVLIFMACMLLARPLQDIAYFTIQMRVIDTVSRIENRNEFAYIVNQELGYYVGRFSGCMMFILLANYVSDEFALRYALVIVGAIQLLIIPVSKTITAGCDALESAPRRETVGQ
jgi:YQGE family putative transporter